VAHLLDVFVIATLWFTVLSDLVWTDWSTEVCVWRH